jgi:hypothetical protein
VFIDGCAGDNKLAAVTINRWKKGGDEDAK